MRAKRSRSHVVLTLVIVGVCGLGAAWGHAQEQTQSQPNTGQATPGQLAPAQSQPQNQPQNQAPSTAPAATQAPDASKTDAAKSDSKTPEISQENSSEVTTHDTNTAFRVPVNLVLVRVVVRDDRGKIVQNLKKEDFRLFDNRKPQTISHFSSESPASHPPVTPEEKTASAKEEELLGTAPKPETPMERPRQFMAMLFDDSDLKWEDLMVARKAAEQFIANSMQPDERVAIYTVSGQDQIDFTDDREKIRATMDKIQQRRISPTSPDGAGDCPSINYYEADQIVNQNNSEAVYVASMDALACAFNNDTRYLAQAQAMAVSSAPRILQAGDIQAQYATRRLDEVVRRVTIMPGARSIILVSPGFMVPDNQEDVWHVIDKANHANVVINTLDARGLYTPDLGDISQQPNGSAIVAGNRFNYALDQQREQSFVLQDLADSTGGGYFHNSNDLAGGFKLLMQSPDVTYLLGFSPSDLKPDGKFHSLKVTIPGGTKYNIQARRGYFAAKRSADPTEVAKQEIEEAVFSQDEVHDLPVELHTQFYKTDALNAKLAVMTHLDLERMQFKKEDGRNKDSLTIVAALFDRNGNYITGQEKILDMKLRDATLEKLGHRGLTVKSSFDVKPGQYVVRLVARDSQMARLTTQNGTVEIPY